MKSRIPFNVYTAIEARRYGEYSRSVRNSYRYNNRMMANLVSSSNWHFKKVLRIRSSRTVEFDSHDKLYAENSQKCFTLRGPRGKPTLLYSIDPPPYEGRWRYEARTTITRAGMTKPNIPECDLRLLLTTHSVLEVRNEATGAFLYSINLDSPDSPDVRFNYMRWDPNAHQVIVSSTRPRPHSDIFCHFIILDICPRVRKKLAIAIRKSIFGTRMSHVVLFDGVIQVTYRDEVVKLYDFYKICAMNKIIEGADEDILQIEVLDKPVYEVKKAIETITFGGYPCHYIASNQKSNEYSVRTLDHNTVATFPANDFDTLTFHPDDTGLIAHYDGRAVTCYKMEVDDFTNKAKLRKLKQFRLRSSRPSSSHHANRRNAFQEPLPQRLTPRRTNQASHFSLHQDETRVLVSDDYENELNLSLLMGIDSGDARERGMIQFFNHETGERVRTMRFNQTLATDVEYYMTLDLDVLIIFATRHDGGLTEATVYRLLHAETWEGKRLPGNMFKLPGLVRRMQSDMDVEFEI